MSKQETAGRKQFMDMLTAGAGAMAAASASELPRSDEATGELVPPLKKKPLTGKEATAKKKKRKAAKLARRRNRKKKK